MRHHNTFLNKKLVSLELIIFFICMLIATLSEAQQLIDRGSASNCDSRLGPRGGNGAFAAEQNFILVATFKTQYDFYGGPDLSSFSIELGGDFTASDLNNSTGGALFYTKTTTGFPANTGSIRDIARGEQNISGPGVYTFHDPAVFVNIGGSGNGTFVYGIYYVWLELSPDANEDHFWIRNEMDGTDFLFDPPISMSGTVPVTFGSTTPTPVIPEITFEGKNGAIQVNIPPSENDAYTFSVRRASDGHPVAGKTVSGNATTTTIAPLAQVTEYNIGVTVRRNASGCTLEESETTYASGVYSCFQRPPSPSVDITNITSNLLRAEITNPDAPLDVPGVNYRTFRVMRQAGSPRLELEDGEYPFPVHIFHTPYGSNDLGNGNYFVTESGSGSILGLEPGVTYELDTYFLGYNGPGLNSFNDCLIYSAPSRITFTTCEGGPTTNAQNLIESNIGETSATLTWTNGDGEGRIVVFGESINNHFTTHEMNGNDFDANSHFPDAPLIPFQYGDDPSVVYKGTGNTVTVTGLVAGTNYKFFVLEYNGDGFCRQYLRSHSAGSFTTLTDDLSVTTQNVTNRTSNSVIAGGNVELINNVIVSERGLVWSTGSNPDLDDESMVAGTGSGSFTATISGLNPERRYFVRAYAIADGQVYYGSSRQFYTTSVEPLSDPTNFSLIDLVPISGNNLSAVFDWDGSGASGYLLLYRNDGLMPTTAGIEDGIHPEDQNTPSGTYIAGDGFINGTSYTQNFGIVANKFYNYLLIPISADQDDNPQTFNYKTEGNLPTLSFFTDVEKPVIASFQPANGDIGVPTNSVLSAQFSENIIKGSGNIEIIDRSNSSVIQAIPISGPDVIVQNNIVTIAPSILPTSTEMYVNIPAGGFEDANGNVMDAFNGKEIWQFTTSDQGDVADPLLSKLSPESGSNSVSVTSDFRMTFNEPVTLGAGNITIWSADDDSKVEDIPVSDPRITAFQSVVTISLEGLPGSEELYITVENGAITDASGNTYAGFNDASNWSFTTKPAPDQAAPIIGSLDPSDNQADVAVNTPLVFTFNEPVSAASGFVSIRLSSNGSIRENINVQSSAVSVNGNMVTVQPSNNLPASSAYFIQVSNGALEDAAGNPFAGITDAEQWTFTTSSETDGSQPQLLSNAFSPSSGAINVSQDTDISFSFNENVFKGSGDLLIRNTFTDETIFTIDVNSAQVSITGNVVTVNPPSNLPEGTYFVTIPATAFRDDANNFFTGLTNESWTFSTPQVNPTLVSISPTTNSGNVTLDATLAITFSEDVQPGNFGFVNVRRVDNGALIASFEPETSAVLYNDATVSFDLNIAPVFHGVEVFVQVPNGVFQDLNGNPFNGFNDDATWRFTLEDQQDVTGPQLIANSIQPTNNATNVSFDTDLIWSFDEEVLPANGQITIRNYQTDQVIESHLTNTVNISNATVNLSRSNALPEGRFYIEIEAGAFEDEFGNPSIAITDKDAWNFQTVGIPPSVDELSPAPGATNVGNMLTAIATFDEPIAAGSGSLLVRNLNTNGTLMNIPIDDPSISISANTLVAAIDLGSFFDIPVYIQIVPGAITDLAGNDLTELNNTDWNFTLSAAPDTNPPVLFGGLMTALSPQRGNGTTPGDEPLHMTFNEEVQAGSGSILLYNYVTDELIQGIEANSSAVTINGDEVTIQPPQLFDDVQTYVLVTNDAFQDNSGNFFGGISDKDDWYFYPEITRPTLVSMNPAPGSTGIQVGEPVTFNLTFSEDIQIDPSGRITILRKSNNAVVRYVDLDDPSVQVVGSQLIFDVTFLLNEGFSELEMYLSVNGTFVTDLNGNNISSFGSFATTGFTAEPVDTTHPFIVQNSFFPTDDAQNVSYSTNLSFEFSEPVEKANGNIHVRRFDGDDIIRTIDVNSSEVSINGTTVTIDLAADLPEDILYVEVETGTFVDGFGNAFTQSIDWKGMWRFYMFEETLEVVSVSPSHGSTNVQVNEPLTFEATFSHPIEINTDNPGSIFIKYVQGDGTRYTIPANDPSISISGNILRFDLTIDKGTAFLDREFYIQFGYGVVRDVEGISRNQTLTKGNWHFETEAATPPEIVSLSPADDASDIAVDENIVITFNEDVSKLNFYATLREYDNYSIVEVFDNSHAGVTVSGNQVTINPTDDLAEPGHYYITLSGNSVSDHEGAGNAGISGRDTWDFFVGDHDDPVLLTQSPEDNASEVGLDAVFTMTFDEPVFTDGAGHITLRRSSGALVENVGINDPRISGLGTTAISVDFNTTLLTSADYYISIGNGVLRDAAGNTYKGITDATTWNFSSSTADIVNPTLSSLSPEDDQGGVATNTSLVLTFSENMQWGAGNILLKEMSGDNLVETFNSGTGNFTINGNQVTLNPATLSEVTAYYVEVDATALEDPSGNAYAGFTGNAVWNFTTLNSDVTAPSVISFSPADDRMDVSKDITQLQIEFDEPIANGTGFIHLRRTAGNGIQKSFDVTNPADVTISGTTVTLHDVSVSPLSNYWVQNSASLQDLAGNTAATWSNNTTWNFGTFADTDPPVVTAFSPPSGTTGLSGDESLTITFDDDISNPASYAITIKNEGNSTVESFLHTDIPQKVEISGNQVTINPTITLDPFREYYITISGFRDEYGNQFAGFSDPDTWNFVVGELDDLRPTITSLTPANTGADVPLNVGTFSITFSEPVFPVAGQAIRLRNVGGNAVRQEFFLDSDDVEIDGNTLTISNVEQLTPGWNYWLQGGTILTDEAENLLDGWVNNSSTWSFTTEEIPDHVSLSPADNATDQSHTSDLVMTFNKSVQKGNGFIKIMDYIEQTEITSIDVASSFVDIVNDEVTITIPGGLPDLNQWIYVLVDEGAFEDANGNQYPGISSRFTWDFQISSTDQEGPSIVSVTPSNDATSVDTRSNWVITFDEDVTLKTGTYFRLKRYSNNGIQQNIVYPSDNISVDGNVVTVEPLLEMPFGTQFWIEIPANLIEDEIGNTFDGILATNRDDWDFTTVAPMDFDALLPTNNSVDVNPNSSLEITFPRNVVKGSGSLRVFRGSTIDELLSIDVTSEEVQIVGNVVTVSPNAGLPDQNLQVHVQMDEGTFVDEFGNNSPAIIHTNVWRFTLKSNDVDGPQPIVFSPADGSSGVNLSTNLSIIFDEPIAFGSGLTSAFLRQADGQLVQEFFNNTGNGTTSISSSTLTFNPSNDLDQDQDYYITLGQGFVEDAIGNEQDAWNDTETWNFNTSEPDIIAPTVISTTPMDGSTNVSVDSDFVITFSEDVQKGSGSIVFSFYSSNGGAQFIDVNSNDVTISGNTVTIDPPLNLLTDVHFWIRIPASAFEDLSGNSFAGIQVANKDDWDFTTLDTAPNPPTLVSLQPADDSEDIAIDAELSITFSEDIRLGANGATKRVSIERIINGSGTFQIIDLTSGMISGNTLTIPHNNFEPGMTYQVFLNKDIITDLDNNSFLGLSHGDWTFTTIEGDTQAPQVVSLSPADNATDISRTNWSYTIAFDEDIQVGSGTARLRVYDTDGITANASIGQHVNISGNIATIDFNALGNLDNSTLNANTRFYMDIPDGLFEDLSGNPYAGHTKDDWDFTTSDIVKSNQSITFNEIENKIFGADAFDISATASSGLNVEFTVVSGPISIDGNTVTITGVGTAVIAANQSGDNSFNPAPEVMQTFEITKADQLISITEIEDKLITDDPFDIVATVDSGLELVYEVSGPASISGNTITLNGEVGTVEVTVSQDGNENYNSASENTSFNVSEEPALAIGDEIKFKFYPNPMTDFLMINNEESTQISIFNLNGKMVKSEYLKDGKVDISDLREGIYFIEAKLSKKVIRQKIIKAN